MQEWAMQFCSFHILPMFPSLVLLGLAIPFRKCFAMSLVWSGAMHIALASFIVVDDPLPIPYGNSEPIRLFSAESAPAEGNKYKSNRHVMRRLQNASVGALLLGQSQKFSRCDIQASQR